MRRCNFSKVGIGIRSLFILSMVLLNSCIRKPNNQFFIDKVYVGETVNMLVDSIKQDSINRLLIKEIPKFEQGPPLPPIFERDITPNALIEAPDGKFYFYSFPYKRGICSSGEEDNKAEFYLPELKALKPRELKLMDTMDVEKSLVYRNNAEREHTFLVFALQKDTTRNPRIVDFVSRITMTSPLKVIWKVRRLLNEENDLLKQLETKKSNGK